MTNLLSVLAGAVAMGFGIAGLFFFRFWWRSGDSLFLIFAIAFWLFAVNQALTGLFARDSEASFAFYSLRLVGFILIALAIVQKNTGAK